MADKPNYKTPAEMQKKIDDYLLEQIEKQKPLTISGLAYHLGFASRQSMYDYEKKDKFSYTIKRAKLLIQIFYEEILTRGQCAGAIFALKNFGWRDDQGIKHSGEVTNTIELSYTQARKLYNKLKKDESK